MVFAAAFVLYFVTLCPGIWVGDSGELIAAAEGLGIPHPTGYPLWLLLNKAFSLLVPFGGVAWRMNLASALCAAGAAELLAATLRRLGCGRAASAGAALAFACLVPIWGEATVARTYPLAALFSAALWWCGARLLGDGGARWLLLHQLLLGFGLANHTMVVAQLPVIALIVLSRARPLLRRPAVVLAALLLPLPGLATYAYLPLRAASEPALEFRVPLRDADDRTRTAELDEPAALLSYLRRDAHHDRRWARGPSDHATIALHHLVTAAKEWSPPGAVLMLLGAIAAWRGGRRVVLAAAIAAWVTNLAPLSLHGAWWDVFLYSRYLTAGFVAQAVLVGIGLDLALRRLAMRPSLARPGIAAAAALALPASVGALNWRACDRRDAWLAEDYGRALLAELPPGAQYIGAGDVALYPLLALRYGEGLRPDVDIVSRAQRKSEADLVLAAQAIRRGEPTPPSASARPLFTADLATGAQEQLAMERHGLLWRLRLPGEATAPPADWRPPAIRGLDRDERDPFARSTIGAIEAALADAAAVRGRREEARARLERVRALNCPRPWGALAGVETLVALAQREQAAARAAMAAIPSDPATAAARYAEARADLELSAALAAGALRDGDPREQAPALQSRQIDGWLGYLDAQQFRESDPPRGLAGFARAAEFLDRADIATAYVAALLQLGLRSEAAAACARHAPRFPAHEPLQQMKRQLAGG
jgi:hypothetical protein